MADRSFINVVDVTSVEGVKSNYLHEMGTSTAQEKKKSLAVEVGSPEVQFGGFFQPKKPEKVELIEQIMLSNDSIFLDTHVMEILKIFDEAEGYRGSEFNTIREILHFIMTIDDNNIKRAVFLVATWLEFSVGVAIKSPAQAKIVASPMTPTNYDKFLSHINDVSMKLFRGHSKLTNGSPKTVTGDMTIEDWLHDVTMAYFTFG